MSKAKIAQIKFGGLEIEGLLLPDGSFGIGVSQVAELFQFLNKNASRDFKAMLGEGFQFLKTTSELHPKAVNYLTLVQFEKVLRYYDRAGNVAAQALTDSLVGLSLVQLFSDAFGIKFDKGDRQEWLKQRMSGKNVRRTLTDSIQDYLILNAESLSEGYKTFIYATCSDAVNRTIFGKTAKQLRLERGVKTDALLRDSHDRKDLQRIDHIEVYAMRLIDAKGEEPMEAVEAAIKFFDYCHANRN